MENNINSLFDHRNNKISKAILWFLIILTLFFAVKLINEIKRSSYIGSENGIRNVITVEGEGEVVAIPDVATFNFSVTELADTVLVAQEGATKKINTILSYIEEMGVEEKDIKTLNYNIYPRYEYRQISCVTYPCPPGQNELVGYEVSQTIQIKVREIEESGELLSGVGERGATNISGLTFAVDEPEELLAEARDMAVEDAQEKAKRLAKALDVHLGSIVNFGEYGAPGSYYYDKAYGFGGDAALSESAAPQIPAGESQIISRVTITYEIR